MSPLWTCPNDDCPPTELEPRPVDDDECDVPMAVCGGGCGATYPTKSYKLIP